MCKKENYKEKNRQKTTDLKNLIPLKQDVDSGKLIFKVAI